MTELRLGTRGSLLALTQSRLVKAALEASGHRVELRTVQTTGDREQTRALSEIGGKGLFTKELDRALLDGEVDLAVHSLKDLPTELEPGLVVAAVPEREDARDALAGPAGRSLTLAHLPHHARVGTSSLRRRALLLAFRGDLTVESIRGNVDTRLRKVDEGGYDAVVLAGAGLLRLGLAHRISEWLERTAWLPAPGQGALALVAREDDRATRRALGRLAHDPTTRAVRAERTLLAALGGGCQLPVAALGLPYEGGLRLWGLVASPDGRRMVRGDLTGPPGDPETLGRRLADVLLRRGAGEILGDLDRASVPGLSHP